MTSHTEDTLDSTDLPHLDVRDWDPPPKAKNVSADVGEKSIVNPKDVIVDRKRGLTFEEIVQQLEEKIKDLLHKTNFVTTEVRSLLKFIHRQTRYSPDVVLNKRIVENIVKFGIAHVFRGIWDSVSKVEYLLNENALAFKNLQTILSIIWNCSDKSPTLCDTITRCGFIQLFMEELNSDKLKHSDLSNENYLYLVKAYLGIQHNIIRLCTDSRRLFRTCHAVTILSAYLHRPQSLVKTKAYLILSYIINEEENNVINATDDNIKFILDILREALDSENHFSKSHAFWATEIVCGLNHLAINDSNKVRMGRLGAFPLYLRLLQSDNADELNLGAAGLWILSFKDENKQILRQQPECLHALESLAASSPNEGIRRACRGALWVVKNAPPSARSSAKSTPERRPSHAVPDVDAPHIMISYHWASQEIMIKVKDKLKAAGYKVWMDVDNMSGSTLEAMALAVERAAVVLVCMSQGFKDSPSCRTEAEYTYRLHKDIVPLVLQEDYSPDGWLGLMVGTRLHFNFSAKEKIVTELPRLIKELGDRGRVSVARHQHNSSPLHRSTDSFEGLPSGLDSSMSESVHSYMTKSARMAHWDTEEVHKWLENMGLTALAAKLQDFDGALLLQYKKMKDSAPQYFYHTLEDLLRLDLHAILLFTKALDDIK